VMCLPGRSRDRDAPLAIISWPSARQTATAPRRPGGWCALGHRSRAAGAPRRRTRPPVTAAPQSAAGPMADRGHGPVGFRRLSGRRSVSGRGSNRGRDGRGHGAA
jgi:hypothetical protein